MAPPVVGIVGAGIGGLTAAVTLRRFGIDAIVFEQSSRLTRVGADVNLTPNAVSALEGLGIGGALRETAARPTFRISRTWNSGEETSRLELADAAQARYGSPQLTMHRADLLAALEAQLPTGALRLGMRLTRIVPRDERTALRFADGTETEVDVLVGADGIHSAVRTAMFGPDSPVFTGTVAYRAVVPAGRLTVPNLDAFTKWWGPDAHTQIVTFPLNRGQDVFVFATKAQDTWREESWTAPGDVEELRVAYRDFHAEARAVLAACDEVLKSALCEREPLSTWSDGTRTLLGDACHPMMPFMAQGAGMAIEDAVVLARALNASPRVDTALKSYETARLERTSRIQRGSRSNEWLRESTNGDWVYAYDAWTAPIAGTQP